jgi:hypothetical protein
MMSGLTPDERDRLLLEVVRLEGAALGGLFCDQLPACVAAATRNCPEAAM